MTTPDELIQVISSFADSPDQRDRAWQLHPAVVAEGGVASASVTFDGEGLLNSATVNTPVTVLIGSVLAGTRVMVLRVPPAGNYVIADLSTASAAAIAAGASPGGSSGLDTAARVSSSATYTPISSHGVAFVASRLGRVMCHFRASQAAVGLVSAYTSVQLATGAVVGAGTVIQSALDVTALQSVATINDCGTTITFTSLTPGALYNVEMQHRSNGVVSHTWTNREVIVAPIS